MEVTLASPAFAPTSAEPRAPLTPAGECCALYLLCHPGSSLQAPPSRPLPQSPVPARCGAKAWLCLLKLTNTGAAPRAPPLPTVLLPLGRPREGGRNEWRRNEKVREEKGNRAGHEAPGPAPRATESSLPRRPLWPQLGSLRLLTPVTGMPY